MVNRNYVVHDHGDRLIVDFSHAKDCKTIRQIEFCSRLLGRLHLNDQNQWVPGHRSGFYILGFAPDLDWSATSSTQLVAVPNGKTVATSDHVELIKNAINGICFADDNGRYHFRIQDDTDTYDYRFHSRARTICALAILFDLGWHPRIDLEIWINPDITDKLPPGVAPDPNKRPEQYYGDPSKTADALRNEGWTRESDNPMMFVEPRMVNGQSQQHYRIKQHDQPIETQVLRTPIKKSWRDSLFQMQNYQCQICLADYSTSIEQLSPDHRIPVVFEADLLNDNNFNEKLMTLCRFCNQSKREFAKRVDHTYDWSTSPWAYPEKFRLEMLREQLRLLCLSTGLAPDDVLAELSQNLHTMLNDALDV
jgi:hypothetical protein